jgi:hypothetical protein
MLHEDLHGRSRGGGPGGEEVEIEAANDGGGLFESPLAGLHEALHRLQRQLVASDAGFPLLRHLETAAGVGRVEAIPEGSDQRVWF